MSRFYPKNIAPITSYLVRETICPRKKKSFTPTLPLNPFIRTFKHTFPPILPNFTKQIYQKNINIANSSEFTTNRVCSELNFTQWRYNFTHTMSRPLWHIPCLSDIIIYVFYFLQRKYYRTKSFWNLMISWFTVEWAYQESYPKSLK